MKVLQVLKYIGIFILTTFLLFWGQMYMNRGNSSTPKFGEALLYYVWMVLYIILIIKEKIKEILGFKNDNENSY
tara:strand:- start:1006 stop:1227 length:222 start_codon:yes stop_codon:yes gene_type:complete